MAYLTKKEADKVINALEKVQDKEIKELIKKIKSLEKRTGYLSGKQEINLLLKRAFKEKIDYKFNYFASKIAFALLNLILISSFCLSTYCCNCEICL